MIPFDQTTFGMPGGNCFSACVASLLEVPLSVVPYFMGDNEAEGKEWYGRFEKWLKPFGLYPVCFELKDSDWRPQGLHILSGPGPRGCDHSVVAFEDKIVHDPHPSRDGLLKHHDVVMLVPGNPALDWKAKACG